MKKLLIILFILVAIPSFGDMETQTGIAKFSWSLNTEPDILAYRLFQTEKSGVYDFTKPIKTVYHPTNTYRLRNIISGKKYFFVLMAISKAGLQSLPSNEVSKSFFLPSEPKGFKVE